MAQRRYRSNTAVISLDLATCLTTIRAQHRSTPAIVYADAELQSAALQFEPVVDKTTVYVLSDCAIARNLGFDIALDVKVVAQTRGMTFVRISIHPGTHRIAIFDLAIVIAVGIGELVFLEQTLAMGWRGLRHEIRLLFSDAAKPRISRCRMIQTSGPGTIGSSEGKT